MRNGHQIPKGPPLDLLAAWLSGRCRVAVVFKGAADCQD